MYINIFTPTTHLKFTQRGDGCFLIFNFYNVATINRSFVKIFNYGLLYLLYIGKVGHGSIKLKCDRERVKKVSR